VLGRGGPYIVCQLAWDFSGSMRFEDHVVVVPLTEFDSSATPLKSPTSTPLMLGQPLPQSFEGVMN
jgi:hypothetical protein